MNQLMRAWNGKIIIAGADEVIIRIVASSDYRGGDPQTFCEDNLHNALSFGYNKLRKTHIEDYHSLFKRVELKLWGAGYV